MPSKMITDRQKTAAHLTGTVEAHAAQAADVFLRLLEPDLDADAPPPDLQYVQLLLSRRLDRLREQLIEVDEILSAERHEDRLLREQRDAAARELKVYVSRLRGLIDNACGAGTSAAFLNVTGRIPRDPFVLYRVASRLVEGLRQGFLDEAGRSLLVGVTLDPVPWIDLLQGPMERLNAALESLARENPETIGRQIVKNSVMEEYDRAYRATANIVENLFRYVGRLDLAERIRPKQRSPTGDRTQEPPAKESPATADGETAPEDSETAE